MGYDPISKKTLRRTPKKKATFSIDPALLDELERIVKNGLAPSRSILVEDAVREAVLQLHRQNRRKLLETAFHDQLFLKDMDDMDAEFADADVLRHLD